MSYEAETIANAFLRIARKEGVGVSNMKIQKLLYFAQGHAMSILGEELISDNCEAWDYGPVFPSVYRWFKPYGSGDIKKEIVSGLDAERFEPKLDAKADALLRAIWEKYGKLSALRLSEMSHVSKGPWATTRRENDGHFDAVIEKSLIRDYFDGLVGQAA